jgi:hypothetical protein
MSIVMKAVEQADTMGQLTEGDGYMIVARDLFQGVEALSKLPPSIHPRSCALLAAHALECVLKAFLWHKGKKKLRGEHNLLKLWDMAYKEGLSIPEQPPDWVSILSQGHGPNFYFRYQEGVKVSNKKHVIVHGGQTPELISMRDALKNLIEMVGLAVKG